MSQNDSHTFKEGDRVAAISRRDFPMGTVVKVLDRGFLLVRWDGDALETALCSAVTRCEAK